MLGPANPVCPRGRATLAALAAAVALGGCAQLPPLERLDPRRALDVFAPHGAVGGRVRVAGAEGGAPLGPAVVHVARTGDAAPARRAVTLGYRARARESAFVALAPGTSLRLVNRDPVHHRLFARTRRGSLEVPLPPGTRAAPLRPPGPGATRLYCALHEDEALLVYVAPSPRFAVVDAKGRFRIAGVPRGRWRLSVWTEGGAGFVRDVEVGGRAVHETIWIDARRARR